jgi:glycosyl transferase family 87
MKLQKWKYPAIILVALALVYSLPFFWNNTTQKLKMDYFVCWSVPHCQSLESIPDIYSKEGQKEVAKRHWQHSLLPATPKKQKLVTRYVIYFYQGRIDVTGTPFLYMIIGLLSGGNYEHDQMIFMVLSSMCFIISIIILCYIVKFSLLSTLTLLLVFISLYLPLFSNLQVGNVNLVQLFIITLYIWAITRTEKYIYLVAAGLLLGVGIMVKPNIALIFILSSMMYLADKKYKNALMLFIGTTLSGFFSVLLSSLYFGKVDIWWDFIRSLPATLSYYYPVVEGNYSITNLIYSITDIRMSLFFIIIFIAVFGYLVWITRRTGIDKEINPEKRQEHKQKMVQNETFLVVGIGCVIMFISAGLTWLHYYILLIPLLIYLISLSHNNKKRKYAIIFKILPFIALFLFTKIPVLLFSFKSPYNQFVLLNSATGILLVLSFYELWYQRKKSSATNNQNLKKMNL